MMYLIVGLGNIGKEYEKTRHNVGFDTLDKICDKYNISINRIKFKGTVGEGNISGEKVILLKPSTYMNLSGESIIEVVNFYKIPIDHVIVIYDDISIDIGRLRIRPSGSAGGHNGIKSIISCMGSQDFPRIRVGTGEPKGDLVSYVLGKFSKDERKLLELAMDAASEAVEDILKLGVTEAMNRYNGFKAEL